MSSSARAEPETRGATPSQANSLDQVREILFGATIRDFERKFARIEALVASQSEELRTDTKRMIEVLEAHLKRETEAHENQQQSDRSAQMAALTNIAREARDATNELDQRIKKLEDGLLRAQRDFRQQLLDEAKGFVEQSRTLKDELMTTLHRELALYMGEPIEPAPQSAVVEALRPPESRTEQP